MRNYTRTAWNTVGPFAVERYAVRKVAKVTKPARRKVAPIIRKAGRKIVREMTDSL